MQCKYILCCCRKAKLHSLIFHYKIIFLIYDAFESILAGNSKIKVKQNISQSSFSRVSWWFDIMLKSNCSSNESSLAGTIRYPDQFYDFL